MPETRVSDKQFQRYKDALTLSHRKYEAEAQPVIERMQSYLRGDQWTELSRREAPTTGVVPLVMNLIFSDIKVMLPSLVLRNPRVFVKPTEATTVDPMSGESAIFVSTKSGLLPISIRKVAQAKEALANWRWRQLRLKAQVRRILMDALLAPFGICKLGYTLTTEKIDPGDGEQLEVNELIKANNPFAVRWPPEQFRVDIEARYPDLSDAGWIAFGWKARLEDVKRNPRFTNTRGLKATVSLKTDFAPGGPGLVKVGEVSTASSDDLNRVQLWEIWDKRIQKRVVLADDHDSQLEYVDWPQTYENFPAETLVFTEYPDRFYPYPDLYQALWQQDAVNTLSSSILNHIYRFVRKYAIKQGTIDEKERAKLLMPVDGMTIEVNDDPQRAIQPIPDAPIPMDWWTAKTVYRDDHDRVTGLGDFIRGVAEKVDTATEASLIQSNLSVRVNDTRNIVEEFAARVTRQILHIDAQTLEVPATIPVIGLDGALALGQFIQIESKGLIEAEADVETEIGSMQPINQDRRKRDILELLSVLRNDPKVDQFALLQKLVPAYQDSIPDLEAIFIDKKRFAQEIAPKLQAIGPPPGGPSPLGGPPQAAPPQGL